MRYLLRRSGFFVLTLWAALTLNFFIPRFMPGSPLQALRDRTHNKLSPQALEQMLESFGFKPHQNIFIQEVRAYLDGKENWEQMFTHVQKKGQEIVDLPRP